MMVKNSHTSRITHLWVIIFFVFLYGCGENSDRAELEAFILKTKAQKKPAIELLPPKSARFDNSYTGLEKRSPFISSDEFVKSQFASSNDTKAPDLTRPKEVLERFALESLTMVGSLQKDDNTNWGLLADKSGRVYKIKEGNFVGQNFGKVTKITEKDIEIKEAVSNGYGGWRSNTVIIKLNE